jgi:hypothetical protein
MEPFTLRIFGMTLRLPPEIISSQHCIVLDRVSLNPAAILRVKQIKYTLIRTHNSLWILE